MNYRHWIVTDGVQNILLLGIPGRVLVIQWQAVASWSVTSGYVVLGLGVQSTGARVRTRCWHGARLCLYYRQCSSCTGWYVLNYSSRKEHFGLERFRVNNGNRGYLIVPFLGRIAGLIKGLLSNGEQTCKFSSQSLLNKLPQTDTVRVQDSLRMLAPQLQPDGTHR